ncbi:haloacid dehalogenase type II [Puerhibacterium sp. TATVAM-FAB25]|uniref:haloacid dehalogenase type II n=1 Tax=Puerhibacterium sp. TATVAM-FAB25 TaxID=3093699 RepID=UPI003979AD08
MRDLLNAPAGRPALVVLDVNETLSDMSPLGGRLEEIGAPPHLARLWFAELLRDGFALTAAGANEPFTRIGAEALRALLQGVTLDRGVEAAVEHVMTGFSALDMHPDVADGIRAFAASGVRLVTLSNGSASAAEALADRAGILHHFEAMLSVEEAGAWKPAAAAYAYALARCDVAPAEAMLVAVHPWDINGAARAGLATAWVNRAGSHYPRHFTAPQVVVGSLTELAHLLA